MYHVKICRNWECAGSRPVSTLTIADSLHSEFVAQSSQIVSKSRSPLRSAPQTLHLFRLSFITPPKLDLRLTPSSASASPSLSAAAFNLARFSASSSASGESGMVSRDEMLGERDRKEVGVDGMDDEAYE